VSLALAAVKFFQWTHYDQSGLWYLGWLWVCPRVVGGLAVLLSVVGVVLYFINSKEPIARSDESGNKIGSRNTGCSTKRSLVAAVLVAASLLLAAWLVLWQLRVPLVAGGSALMGFLGAIAMMRLGEQVWQKAYQSVMIVKWQLNALTLWYFAWLAVSIGFFMQFLDAWFSRRMP
jgi:hypothetical protein